MTVLDHVAQFGVLFFSATSILLVNFKNRNISKWGCILGMCSEPFWFYATIKNFQWGMFLLTCFYTYSWGQGIYVFWIKPYLIGRNTDE